MPYYSAVLELPWGPKSCSVGLLDNAVDLRSKGPSFASYHSWLCSLYCQQSSETVASDKTTTALFWHITNFSLFWNFQHGSYLA